jgi:hypothetical protein
VTDAIYQRLEVIARELEDHAAAVYRLEAERDQLRTHLRRALHAGLPAASPDSSPGEASA